MSRFLRGVGHAIRLLFGPLLERPGLISLFRIFGVFFSVAASGAVGGALGRWLSSSALVIALAAALGALFALALLALHRASPPVRLSVQPNPQSPVQVLCGGAPFEYTPGKRVWGSFESVWIVNAARQTIPFVPP
jgi:hypothetical protein